MNEQSNPTFGDDRVETLRRYDILDTLPEASFDDLALLAASVASAPVAAICFIDQHRNWVKASHGALLDTLPVAYGVCRELLAEPAGSKRIIATKLKTKAGEPAPIPEFPDAKIWHGAPIHSPTGEYLLGAVCIFDTTERKLNAHESNALLAVARQATRDLELRRAMSSLELATVKMQVLIDRDAVTGLPTERVFRGHLRTEFQYARRHGQPLSLVLVKFTASQCAQLPAFHDGFDETVKKLARVLGRDTREYDLVARSGEMEFAIVMRNATAEVGERVATRLKNRIASSDITPGEVPVEFAVSSLTPDMVSSRDMILRAQSAFGERVLPGHVLSAA